MKSIECIVLAVLACILTGCQLVVPAPLEYAGRVSNCRTVSKAQDEIIGGETIPFGDPDQQLVARIMIHKPNQDSVCTATLISDHVLLTAAHCVTKVEPSAIEAKFFTAENCPVNKMREATIEVEKLILHKEFDGTPQSLADVAVLYLESTAPREQVRLPLIRPEEKPTKDRLLLIGFGITNEKAKDSMILRRTYKSFKNDLEFRDRALIVNQSRVNSGFCRGDSGAPVIAEVWGEPFVIGVNSANVGLQPNNECHTLSLAMNAAHFRDWIERNRDSLERATWLERFVSRSVVKN